MKSFNKNSYFFLSLILNILFTYLIFSLFKKRNFKIFLDGTLYKDFPNRKSRDDALDENKHLIQGNIELEPEKSLKSDVSIRKYLYIISLILLIINVFFCVFIFTHNKINQFLKGMLFLLNASFVFYLLKVVEHVSDTNKDFAYNEKINKKVLYLIILSWSSLLLSFFIVNDMKELKLISFKTLFSSENGTTNNNSSVNNRSGNSKQNSKQNSKKNTQLNDSFSNDSIYKIEKLLKKSASIRKQASNYNRVQK